MLIACAFLRAAHLIRSWVVCLPLGEQSAACFCLFSGASVWDWEAEGLVAGSLRTTVPCNHPLSIKLKIYVLQFGIVPLVGQLWKRNGKPHPFLPDRPFKLS